MEIHAPHPGLFLALLTTAASAGAQTADAPAPVEETQRSLAVHRLPAAVSPPELDGRLDEDAWRSAAVASGFVQTEPDPGRPATERTEVRVLVDDQALYVGMRMHDRSPGEIRSSLARRDDADAVSDWAHVLIDSYHDRRTAFHFATTPRGVRVDQLHLDDTDTDPNWDAVWDVATAVDEGGWTAEFRIPLSQLRFSTADTTWGLNFMREISRRSERSYWAPIPPESGRLVSLFGRLEGLGGVAAPRRLEVMPYTLARLARAPGNAEDPFYEANAVDAAMGADIKYGITSDLTLTATINPDFGQVEADPSVVNLTAFETFYPEKRPFFTEGMEIFRFQLAPEGRVFYSRRVGRPPQGSASAPGGWVEEPETARILAAGKLSGKVGDWSVGVLNGVTGRTDAALVDSLGEHYREPIEPLTNYAVARVRRDFREGRSALGVIATATHRSLDRGGPLDFLPDAAYAGGVDGRHRFGGSPYQLQGWLLGTHTLGSQAAMARLQRSGTHLFNRTDAGHLTYDPDRTTLSGWAGDVTLSRIAGNWTWTMAAQARSPGVDVNDTGYILYTDLWYGSAVLAYRRFRPGPVLRNWRVEGQLVSAQTFGGEILRPSAHLRLGGQLLNFWSGSLSVDHWLSHLWPWELRGGPALRRPAYTNVTATLRSDSRTAWELGVTGSVRSEHGSDGRDAELGPWLTLRPSAGAAVELRPSLAWTRNPAQYVSRVTLGDGTGYVVGRLEQATAAVTVRVSYAFTADLALDIYAQPFVSDGRYTAFRRVTDAGARSFDDRFDLIDPATLARTPEEDRYTVDSDLDGTAEFGFRDPDFTARELQSNVVLRWEYRPGSALYLVWTQARRDPARLDDFALGRDLARLLDVRSTNVFMVKLSYWWGG